MAATVAPPPHMAEANNIDAISLCQDLTHRAIQPPDAIPDSREAENLPPPSPSPPTVPSPPLFRNSIAEMRCLSAAMRGFLQRYDDLHNHLETIKAAISAKMLPETPHISQPSPQEPEFLEETAAGTPQEDKIPSKSELEGLCKAMCSRGVRRYLASHLSDIPMLREEVPKAFMQAINPSKLVLESLGKFFLQGSRAFTKNSPMIPAREASILALECFLLMMGLDVTDESENGMLNIDKAVKQEADAAALAWRKRLMVEGGLARANQIDARGLLLFVACFGVPTSFMAEDIRDLMIAGNAKEIVGVLQNSQALTSKISGLVSLLMNLELLKFDVWLSIVFIACDPIASLLIVVNLCFRYLSGLLLTCIRDSLGFAFNWS